MLTGVALLVLFVATPSVTVAQSVAPSTAERRNALRIPDSTLQTMLVSIGRSGRLGFTDEQMTWYGNDLYRLRSLGLLFRDVRSITRYSGNLANQLVANAASMATVVRIAYGLTDVAAGRFLTLSDSATFGMTAPVDSTAPPLTQLARLLGKPTARDALADRALQLPLAVQRMIVHIVVGASEARAWLDRAFAGSSVASILARHGGVDSLYRAAAAPWLDDRLGESASLRRESLELPADVDRGYLAYASVIFLSHLQRGLDVLRSAQTETMPTLASPIVISTPFGDVRISGAGPDVHETPVAFSIDLGGDDLYRGRHALGSMATSPICVLVDASGNDTYDATSTTLGVASAVFGIAVLADLGGNDAYRCRESGIASAWYGTALLVDDAGDDVYVVDSLWGQGAAHIGVAALIDRAGNDAYTCAQQSQALGSTLGAGILVDVSGNDQYVARDDGNISALYLNQSVAMSQGCGYGRRADIGDGHSLAGGFGVLVDGAGNDRYHATAWSQGCGYWWGAGFLEDLGGDDTYRNGKYSSGAAAHFAIGLQSDLDGNDRYNVANSAVMNQFQGHARDGSIGISIDGDGDDHYQLVRNSGGSADLGSIGMLWDRRGDDRYDITYATDTANVGWMNTPPLGTATTYPPSNSFRDDIDAIGVFLDSQGRDDYRWSGPEHDIVRPRDNASWSWLRDPRSLGVGLDQSSPSK